MCALHALLIFVVSAVAAPSVPVWQRTAAAADAAWEAAADGDASSLPRSAALFARAFEESGGQAHAAYWEGVRVSLVGCLHDSLPPRPSIAAELRRELAASAASGSGPAGFTQISQMAALTALDGAEQTLNNQADAPLS
jgi:hypothetical protein